MLILGLETATEQVSVAIGGHEGVLGLFDVFAGGALPRGFAHGEGPLLAFLAPGEEHDVRLSLARSTD